jgi:hypothetical protein
MRTASIALGLATVVACGCGGGPATVARDDPASVSEAAEATQLARTARVGWTVTTAGFGLARDVTVTGSGAASLTAPEMRLELDLAPVLRATGAELPSSGRADVVVRGEDVYVRPPRVRGFAVPGGRDWLALDLGRAARRGGQDAGALTGVLALDPGARIAQLGAARRVEQVGTAEVAGAETTHYRGSGPRAGGFDVWIDARDRVRRLRQRATVPAARGLPRGEVGVTMELSDFGADVAARTPAPAETYDATRRVGDAFAASQ